jgi:uncharacterized protein involved in exopolysaccharide biosynthesis
MHPQGPERESADLFDWNLIANYVGFVLAAPRRHPLLAAAALIGCAALGWSSLVLLPRTYRAEVTLLAERNLVMAALGNPGRQIPREADTPTRGVAGKILARASLVTLLQQNGLVDAWEKSRAPLPRVKDRVKAWLLGERSPREKEDVLVGILEDRLSVKTPEGTIVIAVEWPEPLMAAKIVDAAQRNFVEARHAEEIAAITETLGILEAHADRARQQVDAALAQVQRAGRGIRPVPVAVPIAAELTVEEPREVTQLRSALVGVQRAIEDLEQSRRRRLADLQAELAQQLSTYAPAHPAVLNARQAIEALSAESPQTAALRRQERDLATALASGSGHAPRLPAPGVGASAGLDPFTLGGAVKIDDLLEYARSQLRSSQSRYQELLGRIEGARIELDTTRAAFKYRYGVIRPAEVPESAESPNTALTLLGGLLAGILLAVAAPAALDLSRGRVMAGWQVEHALDLPVLGSIRVSR